MERNRAAVQQLLTEFADLRPRTGQPSTERDVLRLLAQGHTDEAVAARLGLSVRTVRRVVKDMLDRTGARSRFELGVRASAQGWPVGEG